MKIEDISIFGEYKQAENRVTAAFLQICKVGGEDFIRFLTNTLNIQLPSSEIDIQSQVKGTGTVPDGLLESNFSFKLYVESKIKPNTVNATQLAGHQKQIVNSNDFLLYLTPDDIKPATLGTTYWANWLQIINTFNDYLQTSQSDNKQLLEFLVEHFNTLLVNLNLLGYTWDLNNDNVIIVAGSWAEGVAINYNYYICQNKRSFKAARYLAFYNNNQIRHVFEIDKAPEDDINLSLRPEFATYLTNAEPSYSGELRKVFTLKNAQNVGPIINDNIDKNGNPCPYTYGQPRYTKLPILQTATRTSQL
ncbi:MAG: hypothetical protein M9958_08520 [Chitinophagales bacterium]|nr:hypothetical protein [Chitinophagales bacterium]